MRRTANPLAFSTDAIGLKVKELAFAALFQNLPVAFYWMDREGYFLGCNDVELNLHGLSSLADFVGKHSDDISDPTAWENSKKVIKTGSTMIMEEAQHKSTNEIIHYLSIKSPIREKNGKIIGLLGISVDITERKKMEEALAVAREQAESALKEKLKFEQLARQKSKVLDEVLKSLSDERYYLSGKYKGTYLTRREGECVICWSRGLSAKEIGKQLKISPKTVEVYIDTVKRKFKCKTRSELVSIAIEAEFLEGIRPVLS